MDKLFETFVETLNSLPPEAICRALRLEELMLEDDLCKKRIPNSLEVKSVITFCRLVNSIKIGDEVLPVKLPDVHVLYYRFIVSRLIEAGMLPVNVRENFDVTVLNVKRLLSN